MDNQLDFMRFINLFPRFTKAEKYRILSLITSNGKVERALKTIFSERYDAQQAAEKVVTP